MKVLVCTDGSECANKAVKLAAQFAKNYKADLTELYVIEDVESREKPLSDDYGDKHHKAKEVLEEAEKIVSQVDSSMNTKERIAAGPISSEIVRIAENEKFDIIVIGTRGLRGVKRMLLGSVADDVIHYANCPVLVVR
jgi:nucleotide-binding universal stress UspA family protein